MAFCDCNPTGLNSSAPARLTAASRQPCSAFHSRNTQWHFRAKFRTSLPPEEPAMHTKRLIPVAVLALAVACTESTSNPQENSIPDGLKPQLATTFNPAAGPSGAHVQTGTPGCT